jgi:hypothetical protein
MTRGLIDYTSAPSHRKAKRHTIVDWLRSGLVPSSAELAGVDVVRRPDQPGVTLPYLLPSPRGFERPGWSLTAVAVLTQGERPGAPASAMWQLPR